MKKIIGALVTLGVVLGVMTYLGDGLKPWDDGWLARTQHKMQQVMQFGETVSENKLPDPHTLDVPTLPDGQDAPNKPITPPLPDNNPGFQIPNPNPQPPPPQPAA